MPHPEQNHTHPTSTSEADTTRWNFNLQARTRHQAPRGCTSSGMPLRVACQSLTCSEQCKLRAKYGCNLASSRGLHQ